MSTIKDFKQDPYSDYLRKLAFVESGNNPKAKAKTSSATGAHQFIDGTWQDMSKKYRLGYGLEDRYDPKKSEQVAKLYTQENESYLKPIVGRELNDAERYLGHFLGAGGASNLLKTWLQDPNIPISQVMSPQQMSANRSIAYNKDGSPKTVGDIYNWAGKKMGISAQPQTEEQIETPELQTSELSYLADTSLFSNFEQDKDVAELENKIQQQKQNEYNFLVDLIKGTQAQYIEPTEEYFRDGGQMLISKDGVFASGDKPVIVPSPAISMKGVSYLILGKSLETGETKVMSPNSEHFFKNTQNVLETPMLQNGGQLVGIKTPDGKEKFISTDSQEYRDYYNANQIAAIDKATGEYNIPLDEVVLSARRPNADDVDKEGLNIKPRERFITEKNTIPSIRPNKEMSIKKDSILEDLTIEQAIKILPSLEDESRGVMIGDTFFSRQGELEGVTLTAKRRIDLDNIKEGELSNLKREDTIAIQKKLKDEGYLTPVNRELLAPKTKEDIKNVQSMLVKKGYDLGKYGENKDGVDGVMGSKTKGALEDFNNKISGVDGVVGEQTKQAFKNYKSDKLLKTADKKQIDERFFEMSSGGDLPVYQTMLQKQGKFKGIDNVIKPTEKDLIKREVGNNFTLNEDKTCSDNRCTFYVGQEIEKKIKPQGRDRIDAYGDAWTISNRLINKGATEVFSIFDENKPKLENSQIEPYLKAKITNSKKVDTSKVKSGDVVNLFYEGSKFKNQAYKEGDKYFTSHAGIVKQDKSGKLFVEHNVGGKIFKDDLEKLSKGEGKNQAGKTLAITAIIRPNYGLSESAEIYDSEKAMVNEQNVQNYNNVGSKEAALFAQTLVKNQEALKKDIPINDEEFDSLVKASKSIGWKESGFKPSVDSSLKKKGAEIRESLGIKEMSRGLTQMKDEMNLAPSLKVKYVKGKGENLNNPTEAAIPTFYALSSRYLYLKDLAVKEGLRLTADEISKLAILGWNEDIARVGQSLKKYKTFDETIKAYRGETGKHQYDLALEAYDKYFE